MALANSDAGQQAVATLDAVATRRGPHNNLAAVLIEQGRYGEARKELDTALGYNRAHPAALKNLELISRLDGQPATVTATQAQTRWERWKLSIKKLFVGPLDSPQGAGGGKERVRAVARRATDETFRSIVFNRDEQGRDLVEYALIVAAVGLALITTVNQLSQGIVSLYQSITGDLSSIGATAQ